MKGIYFILALLVIGIVAYVQSKRIIESKEGFQELAVPNPPAQQNLIKGDPQPFAPPSTTLLSPPPGQIASVNTLPYQDPAMEKAPLDRIKNALETLKGFLTYEAPGLEKLSDPAVQLPLTTARSDRQRLEDEMLVLSRNPGIESTLTQGDLNLIEANTAFLQKKWRMSANAESGAILEGFQTGSSTSGAASGSTATSSGTNPETTPATASELSNLSQKIGIEIIRLGATGTTDPLIQSRIATLTTIQKAVDQILDDLNRGIKKPADVPITSAAVAEFLPLMRNPNSSLSKLIEQTNSSPALSNLFSTYASSDVSGAQVAQELFSKYADELLQNVSWELNLNYMSKGERELAKYYADKSAPGVGASPLLQQEDVSDAEDVILAYQKGVSPQQSRGFFDEVVGALGNGRSPVGSSSDSLSGRGNLPGGVGFDWKKRSTEICQAIAARGLNPGDYGCMANPTTNMNYDFSWRGYARMICQRLGTQYDIGVPQACGCPPSDWAGWRP
jgi:hypothetical protein